MSKANRITIFSEQARIISHQACAGEQYILKLESPQCALHSKAGSFVHIQCDPELPMRRPLSIMRSSPQQGWIEILYKVIGHGTRLLATRREGEILPVLGPIGNPFRLHNTHPRRLLIGGGVGIPPMVFLAEQIKNQTRDDDTEKTLAIFGSEVPFPFTPQPSNIIVPGLPNDVIATMPLLEDWHIANRLCSLQGYAGHYNGYVTALAKKWLTALEPAHQQQVEIFACGPHAMLEGVAVLAKEYGLRCQISLEEFMACAVGGCAGCVVKVKTGDDYSMKRVCVDGPVFDAEQIYY